MELLHGPRGKRRATGKNRSIVSEGYEVGIAIVVVVVVVMIAGT